MCDGCMKLQVLSWSNYGRCVDTWAPGYYIYSASARNDTGYVWQLGTSAAAAAVTGTVANLLFVDPSLSLYELKAIFDSNTVSISGCDCSDVNSDDACECSMFQYECSSLPQSYISDGLPSTTEGDTSSYVVYDGVFNYDYCNYIGIAEIDPTKSDSRNWRDYFVITLTYVATDKCAGNQDGNASLSYSYSLECTSSDTVDIIVWEGTPDCSGEGVVMKTLVSGQVEDNFWYIVDCDQSSDREDEKTDAFDDSDCDIVFRYYFDFDDPTTCTYNDESHANFIDFTYVRGACVVYDDGDTTYSYQYDCDEDIVYYLFYEGDSCDYQYLVDTDVEAYAGCNSSAGISFEILECGKYDLWEELLNSQLKLDGGTWVLIWFSVTFAGICGFVSFVIVIVTFQTYWQFAACHCCFRFPYISPHESLKPSKIKSINNNIHIFFRVLTTFIIIFYSIIMIIIFIAQLVANVAIAQYEATSWANTSESLANAYDTGENMFDVGMCFVLFCFV